MCRLFGVQMTREIGKKYLTSWLVLLARVLSNPLCYLLSQARLPLFFVIRIGLVVATCTHVIMNRTLTIVIFNVAIARMNTQGPCKMASQVLVAWVVGMASKGKMGLQL